MSKKEDCTLKVISAGQIQRDIKNYYDLFRAIAWMKKSTKWTEQ